MAVSNINSSNIFIHTYIHNWSLQPFSQDTDLAYHSTYVACLKSTSNDRFLWNFLMTILLTLRVFVRNLLNGSRQNKYSFFIFRFAEYDLSWGLKSGLVSNNPTNYLLDYGEKKKYYCLLNNIRTHLIAYRKLLEVINSNQILCKVEAKFAINL